MSIFYDDKVLKLENDLPKNLYIECNKIYLKQKSIDLEIEIPTEKVEQFDCIVINGIKFKEDMGE